MRCGDLAIRCSSDGSISSAYFFFDQHIKIDLVPPSVVDTLDDSHDHEGAILPPTLLSCVFIMSGNSITFPESLSQHEPIRYLHFRTGAGALMQCDSQTACTPAVMMPLSPCVQPLAPESIQSMIRK